MSHKSATSRSTGDIGGLKILLNRVATVRIVQDCTGYDVDFAAAKQGGEPLAEIDDVGQSRRMSTIKFGQNIDITFGSEIVARN